MRAMILSFLICSVAAGCSNKPTLFRLFSEGKESEDWVIASSEPGYEELNGLLSTNVEVRNLKRAKSLIQELKNSAVKNNHLQRDLSNKERWVDESLEARAQIQSLNEEITRLKAEVLKHQQALDEVRRTLVGQ